MELLQYRYRIYFTGASMTAVCLCSAIRKYKFYPLFQFFFRLGVMNPGMDDKYEA
jgi:hypothetical protein